MSYGKHSRSPAPDRHHNFRLRDSKVPGPSARSQGTRRTGLRVVPTRSHRTLLKPYCTQLQLRRKQPDHVIRHWLASRAGHKPEPWGNPTSTEGKVLGLELQAAARQSQHNCVQMTLSNPHLGRAGPSCIDRPLNVKDPHRCQHEMTGDDLCPCAASVIWWPSWSTRKEVPEPTMNGAWSLLT